MVIGDLSSQSFVQEEFGAGEDSEDSDFGENALSSDMGEPEEPSLESWYEGGSESGSSRSKKSNKNFKKFKMKIVADSDP